MTWQLNQLRRTKSLTMADNNNMTCDTWPKVLESNYMAFGDRRAMRYKQRGIWHTYTWKDYYLNVKYLALGLLAIGFKAGDRLLIIGDNSPEWYFSELAAQCNHGISVGLYSDLSTEEIKYIAANSEAAVAIVEDQEQADKLLQIQESLPGLKNIIYWRYKGLASYNSPSLTGFREIFELGRTFEDAHQKLFENNVASGNAEDLCAIIYTSGTTGQYPKGALHTYSTLRSSCDYCMRLDNWQQKDNLVSNLPPAWGAEQWLMFGCHLLSASTVNFPERPETQQQDIREIGPTTVVYNARIWERLAREVQARIHSAGAVKKFNYLLFLPLGYKFAAIKYKQKRLKWLLKVIEGLADFMLLQPLRDSIGLPYARICYTSGAALCPDAFRFFHALGIPLKNLYGTAEAGIVATTSVYEKQQGTLGKVNKEVEIKLSSENQIMVRHKGTFRGYINDQLATDSVLKDGWVLTGDCGYMIEEGNLVFDHRMDDACMLACNELLSPQTIESRLKYSPYIKDAWVFTGPDKDYASVVISIDIDNLSRWADKRKISYTTYSNLCQKPEVYELIEKEIREVNNGLAQGCRIKKFVNFYKEFDADELELTRSRKLRRHYLAEKYHDLVNAIYGDKTSIDMEIQIRYQDTRTGIVKTNLKIQELKELS